MAVVDPPRLAAAPFVSTLTGVVYFGHIQQTLPTVVVSGQSSGLGIDFDALAAVTVAGQPSDITTPATGGGSEVVLTEGQDFPRE